MHYYKCTFLHFGKGKLPGNPFCWEPGYGVFWKEKGKGYEYAFKKSVTNVGCV